jgi:hypothetical protein
MGDSCSLCAHGETTNSGFLDRMMALFLHCHPRGASSLLAYTGWRDKWMVLVARRRSPRASRAMTKAERHHSYHIHDDESRRHGAEGSRRQTCEDGRAYGGGT